MARLTLTVFPGGNAILSFAEELTPDEVDRLRTAFDEWRAADPPQIAFLNADVQHAESIEIELAV